jgi:hypothetical protein
MWSRIALWVTATTFLLPGAAFFVAPQTMAGWVHLPVHTGTAATDVRTVFGALELAIAAYLIWCAQRESRVRTGLSLGLVLLGGMAAGRVVGMGLDGEVGWETLVLLGIELVAAVVAGMGLRVTPATPPSPDR